MHKQSEQQSVDLSRGHTIVAPCTAVGLGALALVRISGTHALEIASSMANLSSGKRLLEAPSHTIAHGWVVDSTGENIDSVLFFIMHAPRTFTGEHVIEISCHNNALIVDRVIHRAIELGARMAHPGEFSERAVLNGKMDVLQAEAINDVVHAQTPNALKRSLAQLDGSLSHWVTGIETKLLKALALCEASFEFLDDETISFCKEIKTLIREVFDDIARIQTSFDAQKHIRDGIRIALLGAVNAGKSSLLNALLGRERAIVSQHAGTTRDTVEAGIYHDGCAWTFIDTAGIRKADNVIEQAGIDRSLSEAQLADIILLVVDQSRACSDEEREIYRTITSAHKRKVIVVHNKCDLPEHTHTVDIHEDIPTVRVSAHKNHNINEIKHIITTTVSHLLAQSDAPFLVNKRQHQLLCQLKCDLDGMYSLLGGTIEYEILSHHLREALSRITQLTGKSIQEQSMDAIFRSFCVGK